MAAIPRTGDHVPRSERVSAGSARSLDRPVQALIALLTLVFVLFPLIPVLYQAINGRPLYDRIVALTGSNFTRVLGSSEFWQVVKTTLIFALLSTLLAVALGTVLALFLTRTDIPWRGFIANMVVIPFYVSPLVLAFAWQIVFGPQGYLTILVRRLPGEPTWNLYSLGGLIVVSTMYHAPYTYLYCAGSLELADPQVEDAGRLAGAGPFRTLWAVTVPLMRPALLYSTLLTFVSSLELLSIPLVLGTPVNIRVLASYLYEIGITGSIPDYGVIAAVAALTVLLVAALVWLQEQLGRLERRFVTVGGKASRARLLKLGPLRWVGLLLILAYLFLGIILPLVGIVAQSLTAILTPLVSPWEMRTLDNFRAVLDTPAYFNSIRNSIIVALVGAAVGIVFITFVTLTAIRSDFPGRRALGYLALFPRAVPGVIMGIGFLYAFLLIPGLGTIRNTLFAIGAAFIMRYLPLGYGAISPSVLRISDELDRAARVGGATWLGAMRSVMLPLLRPALLSGYVLLFVAFLKEYAAALFLFAPGSEVIGTTMISLQRNGETGAIAALATIQMGITALVLLISRRVLKARLNE